MSLFLVLQSLKIHRIKKEGIFQILFVLSLLFFAWFNLHPLGDPSIGEALDEMSSALMSGKISSFDMYTWIKREHLVYVGFKLVLQAIGMIISWIYLYLFLGGKPTYQFSLTRALRLVRYFLVITFVFILSPFVFYIPFIVFYFLTFYTAPFLMTEDLSVFKAMSKSYRLMKTHFSVILIGNILINLFMRLFSLLLIMIAPNTFATILFDTFIFVVLLMVRGRFRGLLFDSFYRRPVINYSRGKQEQDPEELFQRLVHNLKTDATAEEIAKAHLRRREEERLFQKRIQSQLKTQLLNQLQQLNSLDIDKVGNEEIDQDENQLTDQKYDKNQNTDINQDSNNE